MIDHLKPVSIRTEDPSVEVAWFSALCNDSAEEVVSKIASKIPEPPEVF
jgi:hypothetical protein